MDFFTLLGIGVSAFIATNIDDLFIMMIFFSGSNFHKNHVVIGQYVGIGLLVLISTLGAFLSLVIPRHYIGLTGLVPISIGVIRLIKLLRNHDDEDEKIILEQTKNTSSTWNHLSILTVAGVTFSNGADNIGIYTPLFAKYNSILEVTFIIIIFMAMTGVWCSTAYYLVSHPAIANRIQKMGNLLFPFVLIGIGMFILAESFIL